MSVSMLKCESDVFHSQRFRELSRRFIVIVFSPRLFPNLKIMPVAKSLEKLKKQLDELYPNRSTKSDGAWGDQAHAKRKSDHNPNAAGYVQARDFTHDPNNLDCNKLLNALLADRDPRIKYIIWNKKIYNSKNAFAPKAYNGLNAHSHHLHLSVKDDPKLYNDDSDWNLNFHLSNIIPAKAEPKSAPELERGARGESVVNLQNALVNRRYLKPTDIDGQFGVKTQLALQRFQLDSGITADGIAGKTTNKLLGL